jgi:hypothetical protein
VPKITTWVVGILLPPGVVDFSTQFIGRNILEFPRGISNSAALLRYCNGKRADLSSYQHLSMLSGRVRIYRYLLGGVRIYPGKAGSG